MDYLIPLLVLAACFVLWCVLGAVVLYLADDQDYTLLSFVTQSFALHNLLLCVWPLVLMAWGLWCWRRKRLSDR